MVPRKIMWCKTHEREGNMWCNHNDAPLGCEMVYVLMFEVDQNIWETGKMCIPCLQGKKHVWHDNGVPVGPFR